MIPEHLLPLTITWVEPATTTDRYGNIISDWSNAVETGIAAWIEQRAAVELLNGRDTLVSHWLLITNEQSVTAQARIVWESKVFELDGEPSVAYSPAGPHHLEARLLLVTG